MSAPIRAAVWAGALVVGLGWPVDPVREGTTISSVEAAPPSEGSKAERSSPPSGPEPAESSGVLPSFPALDGPKGCLRVPSGPPWAALYERAGPGDAETRFVFFQAREGVVGVHTSGQLRLFVRGENGQVRSLSTEVASRPGWPGEPRPTDETWAEVSSPFDPSRLEDVKPGLMALRPRRCTEVQQTEGTFEGYPATVSRIPGVDLPESVQIERPGGTERLVLLGFVSPEPYVSFAESAL